MVAHNAPYHWTKVFPVNYQTTSALSFCSDQYKDITVIKAIQDQTHHDIFYLQFKPESVNAFNLCQYIYDLDTDSFISTRTRLHNDFNLYSTFDDLVANNSAWSYCSSFSHRSDVVDTSRKCIQGNSDESDLGSLIQWTKSTNSELWVQVPSIQQKARSIYNFDVPSSIHESGSTMVRESDNKRTLDGTGIYELSQFWKSTPSFDPSGKWIWTSPTADSWVPSNSHIWVAKTFYVGDTGAGASSLYVSVDDTAKVYLNGMYVAKSTDFTQTSIYLNSGYNSVLVNAGNGWGQAGLYLSIKDTTNTVVCHTDSTWSIDLDLFNIPRRNYPLSTTDSSLQLYYSFETVDGLSLVNDASNSMLSITANLTTSAILSGLFAKSGNYSYYSDDSNQYITLSSFKLSFEVFTISFWFRMDNTNCNSRIFDFGNGPSLDSILVAGCGDSLYFCSSKGTSYTCCTSSFKPNQNAWYHVAWVLRATFTSSIYINGNYQKSCSHSFDRDVVRTKNYIGKSNYDSDPSLVGGVDDFAIHNRELSAYEIQQLFLGSALHSRYFVEASTVDDTLLRNDASGIFDAKLSSSAMIGGSSPVGSASLSFQESQNQYVDLPAMSLMLSNTLTFSFWARFDHSSCDSPVFDLGVSTYENIILAICSDKLYVLMRSFDTDSIATLNMAINDNVWRYYTFIVYPTGEYSLCVNTETLLTGTNTIRLGTRSFFALGKSSDSSSNPYLNGGIDDFRVYDAELSVAQYYDIFTQQRDMKLYYSFETNSVAGTSLKNLQSRLYDATLSHSKVIVSKYAIVGDTSLSLSSSSSQYVTLPKIGPPLVSTPITIALWVRLTSSPSNTVIFDIGNGENSDNIILRIGDSGFCFRVRSSQDSTACPPIYDVANLNDNNWRHITWILYPAGYSCMYINGELLSNSTLPYPSNVQRVKNYLGRSSSSGTVYMNGGIDDFRFYYEELSLPEIQNISMHNIPNVHFEFEAMSVSDDIVSGIGSNTATAVLSSSSLIQSTDPISGNNYLTLSSSSDTISMSSFTSVASRPLAVMMWYRFKGAACNSTLFGFGGSNSKDFLGISLCDGKLHMTVYVNSTRYSATETVVTSDQYWKHLCWVLLPSGSSRLYINGALLNTYSLPFPRAINRKINWIGKGDFSYTVPFIGDIDDFRVYTRHISSFEIYDIYSKESSLKIYYTFDPVSVDGLSLKNDVNGVYESSFSILNANTWTFAYNSTSLASTSSSPSYVKLSPFITPLATPLVISFWFRADNSQTWSRIFDCGNGAASDNIVIAINNNRLLFYSFIYGSASEIVVGTNFQDNVWRHVVWKIYPSGISRIYINGMFTGQYGQSFPRSIYRAKCYIFKSNWDLDPNYNGGIDDFRLYFDDISEDQINMLTNQTSLGMYFTFDASTVSATTVENVGTAVNSNITLSKSTLVSSSAKNLWTSALVLAGTASDYATMSPWRMENSHSISISLWAKSTWTKCNATIFDFGNGAKADNMMISHCRNTLILQMYQGGQLYESYYKSIDSSSSQWQHIVWTQLTSNVTNLYVNGALVGTYSLPSPISMIRAKNYIGKSSIAQYKPFAGNIDDFRIYSRALPANEVYDLYISGSELVMHYDFDHVVSDVYLQNLGLPNVISDAKVSNVSMISYIGAYSGKSIRFGSLATNYVKLPPLYFPATGAFSIMLNFMISESLNDARLFDFGESRDTAVALYYSYSRIYFRCGNLDHDFGFYPNLNQWYHIAIVVSYSNLCTIYVNGAIFLSFTTSYPSYQIRSSNYLGYSAYSSSPSSGSIDNFFVYFRDLSLGEIYDTYESYPTSQPTSQPSSAPTGEPTAFPTSLPTCAPTANPTCPTSFPTPFPTTTMTSAPTSSPSVRPTSRPTSIPTTSTPTNSPVTSLPTSIPTSRPTRSPVSSAPSSIPTVRPTARPTTRPSPAPSAIPTSHPTSRPTRSPVTSLPSSVPTPRPSSQPVAHPSSMPSNLPSNIPSTQPTSSPSTQPSSSPTYALLFGLTFDADMSMDISDTTDFVANLDVYKTLFVSTLYDTVALKKCEVELITSLDPQRRHLTSGVVDITFVITFDLLNSDVYETVYNYSTSTFSIALSGGISSTFITNVVTALAAQSLGLNINSISEPSFSAYDIVVRHSPVPTSIPTSVPTCSAGSFGGSVICGPCPPGYYSEKGYDDCVPCPLGFYTSEYHSTECLACPYPHTSYKEGSSECSGVTLAWTSGAAAALTVLICAFCVLCLVFARDKKFVTFVLILLPLLDYISDLVFFVTGVFATSSLFIACFACLLLSNTMFLYHLVSVKAWPRVFFYDTVSYYTLWYKEIDGYPAFHDQDLIYVPNAHDSLPLLAYYVIVRIVAYVLQATTALIFVFWLVMHLLLWVPWIMFAFVCFPTKVFAIGKVYNLWMYVWSGNEELYKSVDVDTEELNRSLFAEFIMETVPQVVIQIVNNTVTSKWSAVSIFSTSLSVFNSVNGIYKYGYWMLFMGKSFQEVPTKVEFGMMGVSIFKVEIQQTENGGRVIHSEKKVYILSKRAIEYLYDRADAHLSHRFGSRRLYNNLWNNKIGLRQVQAYIDGPNFISLTGCLDSDEISQLMTMVNEVDKKSIAAVDNTDLEGSAEVKVDDIKVAPCNVIETILEEIEDPKVLMNAMKTLSVVHIPDKVYASVDTMQHMTAVLPKPLVKKFDAAFGPVHVSSIIDKSTPSQSQGVFARLSNSSRRKSVEGKENGASPWSVASAVMNISSSRKPVESTPSPTGQVLTTPVVYQSVDTDNQILDNPQDESEWNEIELSNIYRSASP